MLALEIESERALHLADEGYESGDDYGLPNPHPHINSEPSAAETSFNPTDYQKPTIPTPPLTPK